MKLIRDDAPDKLTHALTFITLAIHTENEMVRVQHLEQVERILTQLKDSMKES